MNTQENHPCLCEKCLSARSAEIEIVRRDTYLKAAEVVNEVMKNSHTKEILSEWKQSYPYMDSLIERTIGELRHKDFYDSIEVIADKSHETACKEIVSHLTSLADKGNGE